MARREAISHADVDETLRTFAGREGVLGAMGVYRAAFTSIEQTEPLVGLLIGYLVPEHCTQMIDVAESLDRSLNAFAGGVGHRRLVDRDIHQLLERAHAVLA